MLIAIYVDRSARGITADLGLDGQRASMAALNGVGLSSQKLLWISLSLLRVNVTTAKPKMEDEERGALSAAVRSVNRRRETLLASPTYSKEGASHTFTLTLDGAR